MPGDTTQSIPINPPTLNWDSSNLHEQWTLFREQCQFFHIDRLYSMHTELACIAVVLNWMGLHSCQLFNNLMFLEDMNKKKLIDA